MLIINIINYLKQVNCMIKQSEIGSCHVLYHYVLLYLMAFTYQLFQLRKGMQNVSP